jgi:hypothetical protein
MVCTLYRQAKVGNKGVSQLKIHNYNATILGERERMKTLRVV